MSSTPQSTAQTSLLIDDLFSVKGKNVLVTGGGRGIGLMLAEGFVRNGAHVFISSRDERTITAVASALTTLGPGTCTAFAADLFTLDGVDLVKRTLTEELHITALHVLVNNSGTSWGEALDKFSEKGWDRVMDLNVKSLFFLTRSLIPLLEAAATPSDPARIVNIGSVTGLHHHSVQTWSYDVSKAAVHHLTAKLAEELAKKSITVNAIAPGYVPTKMSRSLPTTFQAIAAKLPLRRVGTAEDMVGAALFLCSRAGSWITGVVIPVEGGSLTTSAL